MSLFLVEYIVKNPQASIPLFLEDKFPMPADIKILNRVHVVGEARGYALVESNPESVHQLAVMLPPGMLDLKVTAVIDDEENRKALKHAAILAAQRK
jgi:hypothetical protein